MTKSWLSFQQQLQSLKDKGMLINNDAAALSYLERIGYYRLSGYWYPFRQFDQNSTNKRLSVFVQNTHFKNIVELYI